METEFSSNQKKDSNIDSKLSKFSCKICLEVADSPVITPCGHLYWYIEKQSCERFKNYERIHELQYMWLPQQILKLLIFKWAKVKPCCPFCNNKINVDKLTTIYTEEDDSTSQANESKRNQNTNQNNQDSSQQQQEQQQQSQSEDAQQEQQSNEQNDQQNTQDIPRRPQNPRENFQNQNQQQGGFNFNFIGFPGLFFGGGLGLGGFTFNLNGGGQQGNNPQGIQRYFMLFPILIILLQVVIPLIFSLFGINQNYTHDEVEPYFDEHFYRQSQQQQFGYTEYGEIITIIVLSFFIYFIGRILKHRQQQQQQQQ